MSLSYFVLLCSAAAYVAPAVTIDYGNIRSTDQWQSDNGTCAKYDSKCNTGQDNLAGTADGSPSAPSATNRIRRSPQDGSDLCVLPPYPEHGDYYVIGRPDAVPGQAFDVVGLNITCRSGLRATGDTIVFCTNAVWSSEMPQCIRACKLVNNPSVNYQCVLSANKYGESYRDCNEFEPVGTVVKPECNAPHYYHTGVLPRMHCTGNGWDYIAVCTPDCGKITSAGKQLIVGGKEAERGEFPWHVGIYRKNATQYKQICGGSLVSTTIVLSAAHCFWDGSEQKLHPEANFAVAVGKLHKAWNHPDDLDAQKLDVKNIKVPLRFKGSATRFQDDIAIVILNAPVVYKTYVLPVCIDFDNLFENRQLEEGSMGKVAGWGLTAANGSVSDTLQVAVLPYIPITKCLKLIPASFEAFITSDKICAGYLKEGTAVCKGDSGGGLVFPSVERGTTRYYLRGIVSTAPSNDDKCNVYTTSSYTQVTVHKLFIEENTALLGDQPLNNRYYEEETNPIPTDSKPAPAAEIDKSKICTVPPHPENGTYLLTGTPTSYFIQLSTVCDSGFSATDNNTIYCSNGKWTKKLPICVSRCADARHPTVEYGCVDQNRYCSAGCVATGEILPPMTCINGVWDSFPVCIPECGRVKSQQGQDEGDSVFPWHVHIYRKYDCPSCRYERICGGSLINDTFVVTAAHCFWNKQTQEPLPASQFAVAIGTHQVEWIDSNETNAQKSDVNAIHIKDLYQGNATGFRHDIAILVLSTAVVFNDKVGPVCVDSYEDFERLQLRHKVTKVQAIGWSSATSAPPILKVVDVNYVEVEQCRQQSPAEFHRYLTPNKNCIRYRNDYYYPVSDCVTLTASNCPRVMASTILTTGANPEGVPVIYYCSDVCKADSGSGVVFPESDRGSPRYYLRGVISSNPNNAHFNDCDSFPFLTFTRIIKYHNFIEYVKRITKWAIRSLKYDKVINAIENKQNWDFGMVLRELQD